jgi:type IV secretory pathway TrbL component
MLAYCNMVMKYTPLILLSVLSVLLIPIMQTVNAQNPLDQLIGGLKNLTGGASKAVNNTASQAGQSLNKAGQSMNNTASQAGQSMNNTASQAGQSMNNTASQATNSSTIQSNAGSYPGNASDAGNNNISKNNPIGGVLQNATKGVSDTLGKLFNPGNNTTK